MCVCMYVRQVLDTWHPFQPPTPLRRVPGAPLVAMQTVPVLADINSCQTPVYARLTSVQSEPQGWQCVKGAGGGRPEAWCSQHTHTHIEYVDTRTHAVI